MTTLLVLVEIYWTKNGKKRLKTKDSGFSLEAYAKKSPSAFYAQVGDRKTLKTFDAFYQSAQRYLNAASLWLDCLGKISSTSTLELFERIPQERISPTAIQFACRLIIVAFPGSAWKRTTHLPMSDNLI